MNIELPETTLGCGETWSSLGVMGPADGKGGGRVGGGVSDFNIFS